MSEGLKLKLYCLLLTAYSLQLTACGGRRDDVLLPEFGLGRFQDLCDSLAVRGVQPFVVLSVLAVEQYFLQPPTCLLLYGFRQSVEGFGVDERAAWVLV